MCTQQVGVTRKSHVTKRQKSIPAQWEGGGEQISEPNFRNKQMLHGNEQEGRLRNTERDYQRSGEL